MLIKIGKYCKRHGVYLIKDAKDRNLTDAAPGKSLCPSVNCIVHIRIGGYDVSESGELNAAALMIIIGKIGRYITEENALD